LIAILKSFKKFKYFPFLLYKKTILRSTVGVIKNAPSRKKCAKLWRFLAVVYNVVFSFYFFFLA
jgi:hypothetical protein